jgi:hypothetical protein
MARPERLIRIGLCRSSPLRGALRASKTLTRFVELESSSSSKPALNLCAAKRRTEPRIAVEALRYLQVRLKAVY